MALTERWFDASGAGSADGTSWADRADLFSSGNWASEITGHNFTSDGLICYIGPGSYTQSQALTSGILTSYGNADTPLILCGCDSSGNVLSFDDGWQSAGLPTWESDLPEITLSASHFTNLSYLTCKGIQVNSPNGNYAIAYDGTNQVWDRCLFEGNYANSGAYLHYCNGQSRFVDCVWRFNVDTWNYATTIARSASWLNCRIEGGSTGGSGNRDGFLINNSDHNNTIDRCTVFDCPGNAIDVSSSATSQTATINACTLDTCANGIYLGTTASQVRPYSVTNNIITNMTAYAIDCQSSNTWISHNRMRDNSTGNITGNGNWPTGIDNETGAGTDANEFVDVATFDYRIKSTSSLSGSGFGAGDQPSSGGVSILSRRSNTLTLR